MGESDDYETRSVESKANFHQWKSPWINLSCNPTQIMIFRLLVSRVHSPSIHFRKENEIRSLHFIHFSAQSMEVIALIEREREILYT